MFDLRKNVLFQCLLEYIRYEKFFKKWFKDNGKGYYFLFKRGVNVTNIQYAELISLIRQYSIRYENNVLVQGGEYQFLSVEDFNYSLSNIVSSFKLPIGYKKKSLSDEEISWFDQISNEVCGRLVNDYYDILSSIIIVDSYYSSASVFLPPGIDVKLDSICAMSGYIHHCGDLIYIRNVDKAKKNEMYQEIEKVVSCPDELYKFTVYDYDGFSFNNKIEIGRSGMENVKVHLDKFYIEEEPLANIVYELSGKWTNLEVYSHNDSNKNDSNGHTIWLLIDSDADSDHKSRGDNKYYICYLQRYRNANQHHYFNESKPAWKSNTTIPHTLVGAMLNIALSYSGNKEVLHLCDPFAGTGTVFIEAQKIKDRDIIITNADLDLLSPLLAGDNLKVFQLNPQAIEKLIGELKCEGLLEKVRDSLEKLYFIDSHEEFIISEKDIARFKEFTFETRIAIYAYLKVRINYAQKIRRGNVIASKAFEYECKDIINQLELLKNLKQKKCCCDESFDGFDVKQGKHSKFITTSDQCYNNIADDDLYKVVEVKDVKDLESEVYDIIITDPPYGFNSTKKLVELSELYHEMLAAIIGALKNDGQLLMALPDRSYTGKYSPYFTHKEQVVSHIISEANKQNKEIINTAEMLPNRALYSAPFYWESERALRRSIIHMRFRNK